MLLRARPNCARLRCLLTLSTGCTQRTHFRPKKEAVPHVPSKASPGGTMTFCAPRVLVWKSSHPVAPGPTNTTSRPVLFLGGRPKMAPSAYSSNVAGREQGYFEEAAWSINLSISPAVCTLPSMLNSAQPTKRTRPDFAELGADDVLLPAVPSDKSPWNVTDLSQWPALASGRPLSEKSDHSSGIFCRMLRWCSLARATGKALMPEGRVWWPWFSRLSCSAEAWPLRAMADRTETPRVA
mmetsp:Transcript_92243/g.214265  ORF Transcript_92243/g.214265 Transcript_92243/m.214265 type:complete len:239 (+) Transcript_92243:282-998(+)